MDFTNKGLFFRAMTIAFLWGVTTLGGLGGCGGGATAAPAATATNSSLSSSPNTDLSSLDPSLSSGASTLQAALSTKSAVVAQETTKSAEAIDNIRAVGGPSRAGCEANMHKKEIFRMAKQAHFIQCIVRGFETAGLFTVPTGSRAIYTMTPPDIAADDAQGMCDGIPVEDTEGRAACEAEANAGPETIRFRLGIIGGALETDICFNGVPEEEATYSTSGSTHTIGAVHSSNFAGRSESMSLSATVDLGTTGTVTRGTVSLGDGNAFATARMSGGFGSGLIEFDADATTNAVKGAFAGSFTDPFTDVLTTFTGKTYAKWNSTKGAAKFSFTGSPPPMQLADMIPYDISTVDLEDFLANLSSQICGATPTLANYQTLLVCPNENFDPEDPNEDACPMVATIGQCDVVTHTGTECFSISNGIDAGDLRNRITQTFLRTACTDNPFSTVVSAFDLTPLDPAITAPALSRWDCSGSATEIDFTSLTPTQGQTLQAEMESCFAIEEELMDDNGMGGYDCSGDEMGNVVEGVADAPPSAADFGNFGGVLQRNASSCFQGNTPQSIFVQTVNAGTNAYCIPTPEGCADFTVVGTSATGLSITMPPHPAITAIQYTQSGNTPATSAAVTFGSCTETYTPGRPTFNGPNQFGGPGGPPPGEAGGTPQICIDIYGADVTEPECDSICRDPARADSCRM